MSFFWISYLDKKMNRSLKPYMDMEVERLTNNIVNKAIREKLAEKDYQTFFITDEVTKEISYDTMKINELKNDITQYVQDILLDLDNGKIPEYFISDQKSDSRFKHIRKGVLAGNTLNSLQGSALFGNVGPTIPTRLFFVGQIHSDIDIEVKEYGINNVMITIYLIITVKEQVSMPLSSDSKEITVKEPLIVDILKGPIPNYYTGFQR